MPKLAQILEQSSGTRQLCVSVFFLFGSLCKTNRFHVAVGLFSNRSQRTSKCGKNLSDTLVCGSCATSLFLPYFDVIRDLLSNRRTTTWNIFLKYYHVFMNERDENAQFSYSKGVRFEVFLYLARFLRKEKAVTSFNVSFANSSNYYLPLQLSSFCWSSLEPASSSDNLEKTNGIDKFLSSMCYTCFIKVNK